MKNIFLIQIPGEEWAHADEDGYLMFFDNQEQIKEWANQNGYNIEDIKFANVTAYEEDEINNAPLPSMEEIIFKKDGDW